MAIAYSTLRAAAETTYRQRAESLEEAKASRLRTAFLCHSHRDSTLAEGFVKLAKKLGWDVYIDWKDTSLPAVPDRRTAGRIRRKIRTCDLFIFLATHNSTASRWCPWEIGYADAAKFGNDVMIVQTVDDQGHYQGNEYLQLYRRLDVSALGRMLVYDPGAPVGVPVSTL